MEETILKKKEPKMSTGMIIGFLSCLVIVLGGYFIYNEFIKEEEKCSSINNTKVTETETNTKKEEKKEKEPIVEELSLDDEIVKNLFEVHKSLMSYCEKCVENFYSKDLTDIKTLDNNFKLDFLKYNVLYNSEERTEDENYYYISSETVAKEWNKLYGPSTKFPTIKKNVADGDGYLKDGSFRITKNADGVGPGVSFATNKLIKATKSDDEIVLYENVKFFDGDVSSFSDYEKTIPYDEVNIKENYKFTYKKNKDNNYYFYSIEKVK